MSAVVAVIGDGQLADLAYEELADQYEVIRQTDLQAGVPKAVKLVLVLHDEWSPSAYLQAEQVLRQAGLPWLSGYVLFDEGVIGPLVRPGTPGCSQCADTRRLTAGRDREGAMELQMNLLTQGRIPRAASVSRTGLLQMAWMIAAEAQKVLQGSRVQTEGRLYVIDLKTLKSSLHFFLPDPLCTICGQIPEDSPDNARISLQPSPKIRTDIYRCKPMDDLKKFLVNHYLDNRTGLLNAKMADIASSFADVLMNLPAAYGNEVTAGRSHSYSVSEATAILEGLERYCGMSSRGKRTAIRDNFRNLANQALDPVKVGLYTKDQYAQPDFPFEPFDPDRTIDWVWGYSFLQESPILIPEQLAYYSSGFGSSFVHEFSSGCAIGGSLEEAIFYGILEVVERDAFLMTWYAQLPVPRLDPFSATDKELQLMVDRMQTVTGYEVLLFNITTENQIPSIWAIAKNRKRKGVNLLCAAGAHLDPLRAAKGAIHELAGILPRLNEIFKANRKKLVRMYRNPKLLKRMEDHSMLYGLPKAEERLQFLLDNSKPLRTFDEEFKGKPSHDDLTDDLMDILQIFKRLKLDVIVIDQTSPEIERNGLHCVKVLIPGMLPMTFGHHLTRVNGLERVLRVPMELGYTDRLLTIEQLNPHPHPFP